jgi:hypothetical protein
LAGGCQLSVVGCRLSVVGCRLSVVGCEVWSELDQRQTINRLPVSDFRFPP